MYCCFTKVGDISLAVLVEGAVLKSDDATRRGWRSSGDSGSAAFHMVQ